MRSWPGGRGTLRGCLLILPLLLLAGCSFWRQLGGGQPGDLRLQLKPGAAYRMTVTRSVDQAPIRRAGREEGEGTRIRRTVVYDLRVDSLMQDSTYAMTLTYRRFEGRVKNHRGDTLRYNTGPDTLRPMRGIAQAEIYQAMAGQQLRLQVTPRARLAGLSGGDSLMNSALQQALLQRPSGGDTATDQQLEQQYNRMRNFLKRASTRGALLYNFLTANGRLPDTSIQAGATWQIRQKGRLPLTLHYTYAGRAADDLLLQLGGTIDQARLDEMFRQQFGRAKTVESDVATTVTGELRLAPATRWLRRGKLHQQVDITLNVQAGADSTSRQTYHTAIDLRKEMRAERIDAVREGGR